MDATEASLNFGICEDDNAIFMEVGGGAYHLTDKTVEEIISDLQELLKGRRGPVERTDN